MNRSESVGQIGARIDPDRWFHVFEDWLRGLTPDWPRGVGIEHHGRDHDLGTYYVVAVCWDKGRTAEPSVFIRFVGESLKLFNGAIAYPDLDEALTYSEFMSEDEDE